MNNAGSALFVEQKMLAAHYEEVESFQKARTRSAKRTTVVAIVVAGVLAVANVGLAWAVASMLPLTKLVPVYLLVRQDGTIDSSVSLSSLPASQNKAVVRAALWQYVRLREGYDYNAAQYGYDVVSRMSEPAVRQAYQSWFNYPNPSSPQVLVGKSGNISVEPISVVMLSADVAQVRFTRMVEMNGSRPLSSSWTATLAFHQVDTLPAAARLANPGGVVIANYQASEDTAP